MADSTRLNLDQRDHAEAGELRAVARQLAAQNEFVERDIERLVRVFDASFAAAGHPRDAEQAAEAFARRLRRLWLEAAAHEASSVFRSPTEGEAKRIALNHDAFGYERDLQPETLEQRCAGFFPPPSEGWRQDHLIFSSGQAAMTCALIALGQRLAPGRPLRLAHRGAYFETRSLIGALPFIAEATFMQTADIVIDEPICCDGQFHQIDTSKLLAASPKAVIFDTTLLGREDGLDHYLAALDPSTSPVVCRVASTLKLLQGGFELANAGVLSIYTRDPKDDLAVNLRRVRTLTGSGIHLVDAIALEAPWFLDAPQTDAYTGAIFDHNAALASALVEANKRFAPISHPSFAGGAAPYCAFQLADVSSENYDALEHEIAAEAERRGLLIAHGGSFGFRAHRYEVVKPETGDPPFLRVALGRRGGWSCESIIEMMAEIAGR
jgi:hypothetical protein